MVQRCTTPPQQSPEPAARTSESSHRFSIMPACGALLIKLGAPVLFVAFGPYTPTLGRLEGFDMRDSWERVVMAVGV